MKLFRVAKKNWLFVLPIAIVCIFFYKTLLFGQIPYPGDLLVGLYEPYASNSYNGLPPGGVTHKAQGPDVIKEIIPWKKFAVERLKNFEIPFWNPYNFSGNPLFANFQSGVFYPANLLFLILNFENAWSLYIFLTPVLSAYFTYLFLRRLRLSSIAGVFGGLCFSFSLYMSVWMEYGNIGHTFLWLPLVLYFSDRILARSDRASHIGLVAAATISILAGYIQGLFYIYLVSTAYFFAKGCYEKKLTWNKCITFISGLLFPIALTSFQLIPTLELFARSTRGNYSMEQIINMLNPVYYLITTLAPDFFGNPASRNHYFSGTYIERVSYFGLIPLVLSLFASFTLFKKTEVKIFSLLFLISLIVSIDLIFTRFLYLIPIPVISTTIATRVLSVFAFCGSILAAFGLDQVVLKKKTRDLYYIVGPVTITLLSAFIFTFVYPQIANSDLTIQTLATSRRNLILPMLNIVALLVLITFYFISERFKLIKKYGKTIFLLGIFIVVFSDLSIYFHKITPFSPREFMYPATPVISQLKKIQGIDRYWGYGSGYIESNFQTYNGTFTTDGNDPLHIKEYTELLSSSKNGRIPDDLPRPDANIAGGFGEYDLANNNFRQKILNILGVKYVLNKSGALVGEFSPDSVTFPDQIYKLVWQQAPWQIYENRNVTPRAFVTSKYVVVKDKNKALDTLFDSEFSEKDTLILFEDPKINKQELVGSAKLLSYSPNYVKIEADAKIDSLLYISDNYYDGWIAKVDGESEKIYVANLSFRAVPISEGKHIVEMYYRPRSFYIGLTVSIVALISLLLFYSSKIIRKTDV